MAFQDMALWILIIGIFIIAISFASYLVYDNKKRLKFLADLPNDPIRVINLFASKTKNHAEGYETKDILYGKDGRVKVSFIATDVERPKYKQEKTNKLSYEKYSLILDKDFRVSLPKGTWSAEKNYVVYLPPRPEMLDHFGNNPFINSLKEYIVSKKTENVSISALSEGYKEAISKAKAINTGEMTDLLLLL